MAQPAISTVSRQPQTTTTPTPSLDVPFNRLSRQMKIPGPMDSGIQFGDLWTPTLRPVGGYLQWITLMVKADGGSGSGALRADAPWNTIQQVMLKDPFGQPIYQTDGFGSYLIHLFSGQTGMLGFGNDPTRLTDYSTSGVGTDGSFSLSLRIPFQLDSSAYGSLATMNASSQPQLQVNFAPASSVYSTVPASTTPTLTARITESFWAAPVDHPQVAPPDIGSSVQWSQSRAQAVVASGSYQRIVLPRVGTWITTLILVLRDSTNARINAWPTDDLTLWVDGVPFRVEPLSERYDDMCEKFGILPANIPTGVIAYSFRDSVQSAVSFADTHDNLLPTTPATLLEIAGTFGTIANAPATITVYTGELYPHSGIPYNHLAA